MQNISEFHVYHLISYHLISSNLISFHFISLCIIFFHLIFLHFISFFSILSSLVWFFQIISTASQQTNLVWSDTVFRSNEHTRMQGNIQISSYHIITNQVRFAFVCVKEQTAVPIDPDVAKVLRTASAYFSVAATNSPPPCRLCWEVLYLLYHPIFLLSHDRQTDTSILNYWQSIARHSIS